MIFWIGVAFDMLLLLLKIWSKFDANDRVDATKLIQRIRDKLADGGAGRGFLLKRRSRLLDLNRLLENNGFGKLL